MKSVEYVEIVIANGSASNTATLNKGQTAANCVPFASAMMDSSADTFSKMFTDVYFTNGSSSATTVNVERSGSGGQVTVGVFVVEFDPTYVKVQQGTGSISNGSAGPATAGITAVSDLTRAAMVFYHRLGSAAAGYDDATVEGWFSSTSELSFQRTGSSGVVNGHWYVFEALNVSGSYAFSVQTSRFNFSTATGTATLSSSVGSSETLLVGSYRAAETQDHPDKGALRLRLTTCSGSPSTCSDVAAQSYTAPNDGDTYVTAFTITFSSGVVVQRGSHAYASGDSQLTATLSPAVDTKKTMVWNPFSAGPGVMRADDPSGTKMSRAHQRLKLADSTTVQADRGQTGEIAQSAWEAVEWSGATTAVDLISFSAHGLDRSVELTWETASELNNLGFHIYRSQKREGPYERFTTAAIPGLGSSPSGAKYRYVDAAVVNGETYFYKLEDIESGGRTKLHGPVSATPAVGAGTVSPEGSSAIVVEKPPATSFRIVERGRGYLVAELRTGGFTAIPLGDGSVRFEIPGFVNDSAPGTPDLPKWRSWIEAVAGRSAEVVAVQETDVETFSSLRPSVASQPELVGSSRGTVSAAARRARRGRAFYEPGLYPESAARVASEGYQGAQKKALLEISPLRWNRDGDELVLAHRIVVRIALAGPETRQRERTSYRRTSVARRFFTSESGLYGVRFEDAWSTRSTGVAVPSLSLSRGGEAVAFHVEPDPDWFGPGSTLYFVSAGGLLNPYGREAVYELERRPGLTMEVVSGAPAGASVSHYWQTLAREENRYYQAGLLDATDLWLWDILFAPTTKRYSLEVDALASTSMPASLQVWLQGVNDAEGSSDHHVRLYVNGAFLVEATWDGKRARKLTGEIQPGLLHEGANELAIENVGDTGAPYSMVMLDRYALSFPRRLAASSASSGRLEGRFDEAGAVYVQGLGDDAFVLDLSTDAPRWLTGVSSGFRIERDRKYLAVARCAVLKPRVESPPASRLKSSLERADYLVIGPQSLLPAAAPLLELRRRQGLRARAVDIEHVFSEFGFGEERPEALKDFLIYAYQHWRRPAPRYVLLLGDGTYDFKDYLKTGVQNRVPPYLVKTSYLWTASDPALAAVNGDDLLPDLAIGRLPAANETEARAMVDKILSYETTGRLSDGAVTLVADNPDAAGDFESHAAELARGLLAGRSLETIYLSRLGPDGARSAIRDALDRGTSLLTYMGHGGIHLWASENIFDIQALDTLEPQAQQPLLLTLNCLNGYFHFPYFDSLGEAFLKAKGKGAVASFSPSGLSLDGPAHTLHKALLTELLSGRHRRLGDAILAAQSVYASGGDFPELLQIYHLLGDPALSLR